jgi:ribosome recycling factor
MSQDTVIKQACDMMAKAAEHTLSEFSKLHTGKASPSMVENIQVEVYGSKMHLREVAAVTTPDPRTIQIQPWDKTVVSDIVKSIQKANLGFNPVVNGNLIRIPIPDLSRERRQELTKVAHTMAEEGHISVRHARHDAIELLKKMQKNKEISEDDQKHAEKEVQIDTDKQNAEIDQHLEHKEKELMTL